MKVIRYNTEGGSRMAVCGKPGRIYTQLVWIDSPMRKVKVPNGDLTSYGYDVTYKLKRAARLMLKAGKRLGITKGAKQLLRDASRFTESSSTTSQSRDNSIDT